MVGVPIDDGLAVASFRLAGSSCDRLRWPNPLRLVREKVDSGRGGGVVGDRDVVGLDWPEEMGYRHCGGITIGSCCP